MVWQDGPVRRLRRNAYRWRFPGWREPAAARAMRRGDPIRPSAQAAAARQQGVRSLWRKSTPGPSGSGRPLAASANLSSRDSDKAVTATVVSELAECACEVEADPMAHRQFGDHRDALVIHSRDGVFAGSVALERRKHAGCERRIAGRPARGSGRRGFPCRDGRPMRRARR